MTAKVMSFVNLKGGVGKSTTLFHIGRAAVLAGQRVLFVDNDPQGSLTNVSVRDELEKDSLGLADAMSRQTLEPLENIIVQGVWDRLSVVPTVGENLTFVRDELVVSGAGRERRLKDALKPILDQWDLVLVDCGPALDLLTINALTASDVAVIVTETKQGGVVGVGKALSFIKEIQDSYNPRLRIANVVVNRHEARTIAGREWLAELESIHAVASPVIPKAQVVSDSFEAASGIDQYQNEKSVELGDMFAELYRELAGA